MIGTLSALAAVLCVSSGARAAAPAAAVPVIAVPQILWEAELDENVRGGVAAGEGLAFVALTSGKLQAFELENGKRKWSRDIGASPLTGPAYSAGLVLVADTDRQLSAYSAADGKRKWRAKLTAQAVSELGVGDDTVCLGEGDMACGAFVLADGVRRWRVSVLGDVIGTPWVGGKRVIFGSTGHKLYSVAKPSGEILGETVLSGEAVGSPGSETEAAKRAVSAAGTHDGFLYALTPAMEKLWKAPVHGIVRAAPLLGPELVFAGTDQGMLYAFRKGMGTPQWARGLGGPVVESLVLFPGLLLVGSGGALYFLDIDTGAINKQFVLPGKVRGLARDAGVAVAVTSEMRLVAAGVKAQELSPPARRPVLTSLVADPVRVNPARGEGTMVTFSLLKQVPLTVDIADARGRRVVLIANREQAAPGTFRFVWNGKGEKGATLPPGVYRARVVAGTEQMSVGIELMGRR